MILLELLECGPTKGSLRAPAGLIRNRWRTARLLKIYAAGLSGFQNLRFASCMLSILP